MLEISIIKCYNYNADEQANLKQKVILTADHEKRWDRTRKVHITSWSNSMSKGFLVGGFYREIMIYCCKHGN